jgi:hypothetical protein
VVLCRKECRWRVQYFLLEGTHVMFFGLFTNAAMIGRPYLAPRGPALTWCWQLTMPARVRVNKIFYMRNVFLH